MYDNGQGVALNHNDAFRWFRLAAMGGMSAAQFNLGIMYENGRGVQQNMVEAVRWYQLAANQGVTNAQFNLAVIYTIGKGVERNPNEAVRYYIMAARKGHADAQNNLGLMYRDGIGIEKNLKEAVYWLTESANQGNMNAKKNLILLKGDDIPRLEDGIRLRCTLRSLIETDWATGIQNTRSIDQKIVEVERLGDEFYIDDIVHYLEETLIPYGDGALWKLSNKVQLMYIRTTRTLIVGIDQSDSLSKTRTLSGECVALN